jgi:hypothetical protein
MATADQLRHPELQEHVGSFLIGSTAPDIRVITRQTRERYHFADLDFDDIGAGVKGMFAEHPRLWELGERQGATRAFVAGYITHLMVDEAYIVGVYRAFFADSGLIQDSMRANLLDRALQLDMDRQVWERAGEGLATAKFDPEEVDIGFLDVETLGQWRDWVLEVVDRGFTWDRLRFMARRIAAGDDVSAAERFVDEFIEGMPGSLDQVYALVPRTTIDEFRADAVGRLVVAVGEYLS